MKKHIIALSLATIFATASVQADIIPDANWSFADVSLNQLNWQGNAKNDGKDDFHFVELEGGAAWDLVELYGFWDLETHDENADGWFGKAQARWNVLPGGFQVFNQYVAMDYDDGFEEQNYFVGFSRDFATSDFKHMVKTHIAKRWTEGEWESNELYSGSNGYQLGLTFLGTIAETKYGKFSYSSWNEINFDRESDYHSESSSFNGAAALWWGLPNTSLDLGLQYRYAKDDLGAQGNNEGYLMTARYNF